MFRTTLALLAAISIFAFAASAPAQECIFKTNEDETLRQALGDFHDVLAALVHGPAEKGDYAAVRARAGELARLRNGIMSANLPAKLAKRCADISAKAKALSGAVDRLAAQSGSGSDDAALKAAFESVHGGYRALNGSLTTLDDLLEAFHDLLRPLWHDAYPKKDAAAIKAETPKLKVRSKLILGSAESSEKARAPGAKALLEAVTTLEEAVAAKDDMAVLEALRLVHDAYEKLAESHD